MYYNNYSDVIITTYIVSFIVSIVVACVFGAITKSINEGKGYYGGFAWGFWLGIIGIIVVACRQPVYYEVRESIIVPKQPSDSLPPVSSSLPAKDSWQCSCGRYNAKFVTSCVCGMNKRDILVPKAAPAVEVEQKSASVAKPVTSVENEAKIISLLKEYKELLDAGIITQEEFEAKKKSILSP